MSNPNEEESFFNASTADEKNLKAQLLRSVLPECQPQEGSPANTFTTSELEELQAALPRLGIESKSKDDESDGKPIAMKQPFNKLNIIKDSWPSSEESSQQKESQEENSNGAAQNLDWHGAPRFCCEKVQEPRAFREEVRAGRYVAPTNAVCPGFMQCNLVVLPQGKHAFDFLLFCQRNPQACPLVEVCDVGSPVPTGVAPTADLRTDVPKYAIYRDGKLDKQVTDVTDYWPKDSVAFLIGCSFSYDGALMDAGIPLKSAEQGKNVPMYRTSLKCRSAGSLKGNMVVSMKPIPALKVAKEVEITTSYPHAHGGPVCIGTPGAIGITDVASPDWGDSIDLDPEDVPVFHACGVTPQNILMNSKVPFAITHSPGYMFVTDLPSNFS